jgi:hypothetical protein
MVFVSTYLTSPCLTVARTVIPLANSPGGHRLGVNGLALDHERSILYVQTIQDVDYDSAETSTGTLAGVTE